MKTLIAYSSTHGTAAECARWLEDSMTGAEAADLKQSAVNPQPYDLVILGSSIYGGQIQREVRDYCKQYLGILLQKPLGIYLTCLTQDQAEIRHFLDYGLSAEIVQHLTAFCTPGGAVYLSKMGFLERSIAHKLLNRFLREQGLEALRDRKTDYVTLSKEKVERFARQMSGAAGETQELSR